MSKYLSIFLCLAFSTFQTYGQKSYLDYHNEVIKCEKLIVEQNFRQTINVFDSLFNQFDFVFLRDLKLATEISAFEQDENAAFRFLRRGIVQGWTWKSIKKNERLDILHQYSEWSNVETEYDSLHLRYLSKLNKPLRIKAQELYKKDQKMALKALFRIGEKSQTKYAEKKFAPHSEEQLEHLNQILVEQGYPGEQLIGNSWWVSVILSHHNSISKEYNQNDTLYLNIRPRLIRAIEKGELHPYEFATIEDWRTAAMNNHDSTSYGFLGKMKNELMLEKANLNRNDIGLRSIALRNDLIEIEKTTGLNLYLPKGWQNGKITVADK